MKWVLLAAAFLAATAPLRAETKLGGEASVTLGGKPEFYSSEDGGHYGLVTGMVTASIDKTWSLALTESVLSVVHPEKKVELTDPIAALGWSYGKLTLSLTATPGLSLASRDAGLRGTLMPSLAAKSKVAAVSFGAGTSLVHRFFSYTFSKAGTANPEETLSLFAFGGLDVANSINLGVNFARLRTKYYAGPVQYNYSNGATLSWQATDAVTFVLGAATSDSLLQPDGSDNNELTLYKRNKSEMYLSAAYAL